LRVLPAIFRRLIPPKGGTAAPLLFLSLLFIFFPAVSPALSSGPSFEEEFSQGLSFYKKEDYSSALKTFQQVEEEFKDNRLLPDAVFMQGQALRALGNWDEAAKTFSRAAEAHRLLPDYALFFQGEALDKMGEGEKGITVLQSLVDQHPQSLLVPQALQRIAELSLRSGNYSKTLEIGERLLKGNGGKDFSA
jgi:tetratricopeptide (TPR) repeat protein